MTKPIIVPLDGSPFAETALPAAVEIAERLSAPLHLLTIHVPPIIIPGAEGSVAAMMEIEENARTEEVRYLESVARRISQVNPITVIAKVIDGLVEPSITGYATAADARAVVLSSHGRGGLSRMFLGNVADRLIRSLDCPVLVVRATNAATPARTPGPRRVLVPLDGSRHAETVIDQVAALSSFGDTAFDLVRVVPNPPDGASPSAATRESGIAANYLATVSHALKSLGLMVRPRVLVSDNSAQAILDYAAQERIDLIAIATRGVGGVTRALLGSVADKVIRGAAGNVLVWNPAPGARSGALGMVEDSRVELVSQAT